MSKAIVDGSKRKFLASAGGVTGGAALAALFASGSTNAQTLELNAMGPTPAQMQAFLQLPERPVVMVNLLKFSDADAYAQYGLDVAEILQSIGAEIIFSGECQGTLIGGAQWDSVALVRYPSPRAMMQMAQSAEYQAISGNRTSGLTGQMNLAVFEAQA